MSPAAASDMTFDQIRLFHERRRERQKRDSEFLEKHEKDCAFHKVQPLVRYVVPFGR